LFDDESKKIVLPGYYGFDGQGLRHLLGNGGSDRTGALATVGLEEICRSNKHLLVYENWTDQDGIRSGNPRTITNTKVIDELTRTEVREGAHGGNEILQGDTIVDMNGCSAPIVIKNTFNPESAGTRVVTERHTSPYEGSVVAISGRPLTTISIEDLGMADRDGYLSYIMDEARDLGLSIEHMPAAQDAVTLTLHQEVETEALDEFISRLGKNLVSNHGKIESDKKGVVYLVGESLRDSITNAKTLGRASLLLSAKGIGIEAVISHPGSPSIALLVSQSDTNEVQQLIHQEFIEQV
jgi:aspartate kinase